MADLIDWYVAPVSWLLLAKLGPLQMQRVIQMNVIPDVVPRFTPSIDLAVSFGESPAATGGEPGAYLLPSQVCLTSKPVLFPSDSHM